MFSEETQLKYSASTTHLELQKGILESENPSARSICFRRKFTKVPVLSSDTEENRIIGRYFDVGADGHIGANETILENIRQDVLNTGSKMISFSTPWHPNGVEESTHQEYLEQFGKCVKEEFVQHIKDATQNRKATKNCVEEAAIHMTFCASRSQSFYGREDLVKKTLTYAHRKKGGGNPLVVFGDSGAGKTSLLAKAAMASKTILSKNSAEPILIVRFCGTSPGSSSAPDLVQSILEQMSEVLEIGDLPQRSAGFKSLYTSWHNALKQANCHRPLLIVIDSIDQLSDECNGRAELDWIPDRLPAHVYLIVSTLPHIGGCFSALKKKSSLPQANFVQVEPLSMKDASSIIQGWLTDINRTLTDKQFSKLTSMATDDTDEKPSALRLKLLFDRASKWTSFQDPPDLPRTVQGLIGALFCELESDHGMALVSHFCGIIGMSRHGLSEHDMKDILSGDEEVLDHVFQYHKPSMRRLPDIVFARLLNALQGYIVQRSAFQKTVLYWYHRQFWTAAEERYLSTEKDKAKYAALIAKYFNNDMQQSFPERNLLYQPLYYVDESNGTHQFNQTKLEQLPQAFINCKHRDAIDKVVFNLSFLAAKIEAGMGRHLLYEFTLIPRATPRQEAYMRFITANLHILEKFPTLIYQRSRNVSNDNPMHKDVSTLTYSDVLPWIGNEKKWKEVEHLNKPLGSDPCTMVIESPVRVTSVTFSKLQNYILTTNTKNAVAIWDPKTGKLISTLDYGSTLLAFCSDQSVPDQLFMIAACGDGAICIRDVQVSGWDVRITHERSWKAYSEAANRVSMALSNSGQKVLTASQKGKGSSVEELKLWSVENGHTPNSPDDFTVSVDRVSPIDRRKVTFKICQVLFSPNDCHCVVVLGLHSANSPLSEKKLITIHDSNLKHIWTLEEEIQVPKSVSIFQRPEDSNIWYLVITAFKNIYLVKVDTAKPQEDLGTYICAIQARDPVNNAVVTKKHPVIMCGMFNDIMVWGLPGCSKDDEGKLYKIRNVFKVSGNSGPKLWNVQMQRPLDEESEIYQYGFLRGHNRTVRGVAVDDNNSCCTISQEGQLRLWDLDAFYNFKTPAKHDRSLRTMTLSPDNRILYTASLSGDVMVWDSTTGELKKTIIAENFESAIASMAISPDNRFMCCVVIDEPTLYLIDVVPEKDGFLSLEDVKQIHIPLFAVSTGTGESGKHSVKFSSDGSHILGTIIRSRQAFLFDVMNGKMLLLAEHHSPIRSPNFTPDGKIVVTNSYGPETDLNLTSPCKIYNIATKEYTDPKPSEKQENFFDLLNIAFLKSGKQFLASTSQKALQLRNFPSFEVVSTVENAHGRPMRHTIVVESPKQGSEYCVTSDHDGFIRVWTVPELKMLAMFCNDVPVNSVVAHFQDDGNLYICCGDIMGNVKILRVKGIK